MRTLVHRKTRAGSLDAKELRGQEIEVSLLNAFENGYDAVVVTNHSAGKGQDILVVKDGAQLRDPKTAAFDPGKRDLRDISASLLLGGAGLGALSSRDE